MTARVGFLMLVHGALDRAASVARHWHSAGCPVVVHVDSRVPHSSFEAFATSLSGLENVHFVARRHCEWGTWSLVDASLAMAEEMLQAHPDVSHVFLASGACLPLRPVADLEAYLAAHRGIDFVESVAVEDVPWAKGGLDVERFQLSFPFAWKRRRRFFDLWVALQRLVARRRPMPEGVAPHLGSQWWCLTRRTVERILYDPRRRELERYFRKVWIPDESYIQTLVRLHGARVESRSLTLSKFDFQGKPHVFYDDHLDLLRRSDCFVARKIWPEADALYRAFLEGQPAPSRAPPNPVEVDRRFARALERRTAGRDGLYSAARFPADVRELGLTAARYTVFHGLGDLFEEFPAWAEREMRLRAHGHLFAAERAEFADGLTSYAGGLADIATLRDYNPTAFLANLVWNTRGETQAFLFGPQDSQKIAPFLARDRNARIYAISGTWAVRLFRSGGSPAELRKEAARLQRIEAAHLQRLRRASTRARVRIWTLAEFLDLPSEVVQTVVEENRPQRAAGLAEAPVMHDLTGLSAFLQELKNQGMQPHLTGDVTEVARLEAPADLPKMVR
ncbi:MAG: beta-1,6-N-acetylglucosaminyltransferase [Paracoccaceae bacterium]|nr:beta-1,6-N-acetylglucosaminyltransferase [Paracoccaceae bacterium]